MKKYIMDFKDGDKVNSIFLVKTKTYGTAKTGNQFISLTLQDKTGTMDAKIFDPNSGGIDEFAALDYIEAFGDVSLFNSSLQLKIKRVRLCRDGEYDPADFVPSSERDNDEMYEELQGVIKSVTNKYLHRLLLNLFVEDEAFVKKFRKSSAAKSVHHAFVGGLMEHTLGVAAMCVRLAERYPLLNYDLLVSAGLLHDIGKTRELALFPANDYTDEGQFLGHIVIGTQMIDELTKSIPDFPPLLKQELEHCIVSHHGTTEYGSPKVPAIPEAIALNFADLIDSRMEIVKESLAATHTPGWQGYNKLLGSQFFETRVEG